VGSRVNWRWIVAAGVALCALLGAGIIVVKATASSPAPVETPSAADRTVVPAVDFTVIRRGKPDRTEVRNAKGAMVAVFTDGARTVRLAGTSRTFAEPRFTKAVVTTDAWIRLAPQEWKPGAEREDWFRPWLEKASADQSPDALAIAMEYVDGAEKIKNDQGLEFSGDASFGPVDPSDPDGRAENSDFYDYLGVKWEFRDGKKEKPDAAHFQSLDCSGFLRMVYGYRLGYPLRGTNTAGPGLPRRAYAMAGVGPGALLIPNRGKPARDYGLLQPGDLVFFNAGPTQGPNIEHSGIYLGLDDSGHHRFISSRATANGPTLGDAGGDSLLDGPGYWSSRFRTARRI
jgi:hypothetical protein